MGGLTDPVHGLTPVSGAALTGLPVFTAAVRVCPCHTRPRLVEHPWSQQSPKAPLLPTGFFPPASRGLQPFPLEWHRIGNTHRVLNSLRIFFFFLLYFFFF